MAETIQDYYDALNVLAKYAAINRLPYSPYASLQPSRAIAQAEEALQEIGGRTILDAQYANLSQPANATLVPPSPAISQGGGTEAAYRALARQAAQVEGFDPDVFEKQIQQESGFNPNVVSPKGARGIAQIMPFNLESWGNKFIGHPLDPNNVNDSLHVAAAAMAKYMKDYGSSQLALIAYNAGPGIANYFQKNGTLPDGYDETKRYLDNILGEAQGTARPRNLVLSDIARSIIGGGQDMDYGVLSLPFMMAIDGIMNGLSSKYPEEVEKAVRALGEVLTFGRKLQDNVLRGGMTPYEAAQTSLAQASHGLAQQQFGLSKQQFEFTKEEAGLNREERAANAQRQYEQQAAQFGAGNAAAVQAAEAQQAKLAFDVSQNAFAPGQEYWRGYEPGGAQQALSNWNGLPFAPISRAQGIPVSTDVGADRLRAALVALQANYPAAPVPVGGGRA